MKRFCLFFVSISIFLVGTLGCQPEAVNGADGIGDPYYPQLGNGGYDVQKYTIVLEVNPASNTVNGKTIIEANATERLKSLNLDFQGLNVDSVSVNSSNATFSQANAEMTVVPESPLSLGRPFTVEVSYHGTPTTVPSPAVGASTGWFHSDDGTINVISEPDGASTWFPNNNHPRDKALYHMEIEVPNPWIVAATGTVTKTVPDENNTRYIIDMEQPAASYLVAISIGKYDLEEAAGPNGIRIRNYFPTDYPQAQRDNFAKLPEMIQYLESVYGSYPFKEYGVVIASSEIPICSRGGTADETQTLSIHCPSAEMSDERVILHELAHQWFGDNVSLENWQDVWLKEGMATYAEWLWVTRNKSLKTLNNVVNAQLIGYYSSVPVGKPPSDALYRREVYTGGALVFHALRLKVGDEKFFKILHTYLERYGGKSAGTDEFIKVAEEVSGQNLQDFFNTWLFKDKLPPIPGL
jgi:aminopeptidase N